MHTAAHASDAVACTSSSNYRRCNRLSFRSPISHSVNLTNRVAVSAVAPHSQAIARRMASLSASASVNSNGDSSRPYASPSSSYIRSYGRQSNNVHRSRPPSLAIIKALQQQQQQQQHLSDTQTPPPASRKISAISQMSINGLNGSYFPTYDDQASAMSDQLSINLSILLDGKIDWRIKVYRLQLRLLKYAFILFNSIFIAISVYSLFISNNLNSNLWRPENSLIILALMFGIILSGIAISGALKEQLYLTMTYSIIFTILLIFCYAYYYKTLATSTIVIVFSLYLILCYYYCYILHLKPSPTILPDGTLIKPKEHMLLNSIKRKSMRRQSSLTSGVSGKKCSNATSASVGTIVPSVSLPGQSSDTVKPLHSDQAVSSPSVLISKSSVSESDIPRHASDERVTSGTFHSDTHGRPSTSHVTLSPDNGGLTRGHSLKDDRNVNADTVPSSLPIIQFSSVHSVV